MLAMALTTPINDLQRWGGWSSHSDDAEGDVNSKRMIRLPRRRRRCCCSLFAPLCSYVYPSTVPYTMYSVSAILTGSASVGSELYYRFCRHPCRLQALCCAPERAAGRAPSRAVNAPASSCQDLQGLPLRLLLAYASVFVLRCGME